MIHLTNIRVSCDGTKEHQCYNDFTLYGVDIESETITEIKNNIRGKAREENFIVTRKDNFYCPRCAKELKLRNANKKE